ncbi:WD repeat domain containing protein [Entamoeba histolytica HM-1:IMSS-B]|uniref:Protein TRANSPARENT TESTA GLABRA n=6 Tax=Entamoeba histolytica TaxID=5759 RepID=C4LUP6_ENTH1|nr:hypothetical protein, conserved [Entamoeba histolytica HM-1:IMSS]EMD45473.1 protein transparent testa glabra [Entamoeba histolytica KU27]EMH74421.1 WD repeat domain containing protein [Entamoeba histolytica HM-1:IMSS-B]EMS14766.1 protein TRANSPARENT TESTA GLABRA, putative [Entamoeba histolytica HM-3:IMSS]ENY59874.1 protein TRANSPARENT TESTA GLABRA, putative [Entamoeba histolytica HM-1:IMSS-A]GAT92346.1 hypothetical protein conserved [Entamoeba histolytica]|eukprot:XP_655637.1 hypothetical protein, conserved [Entamoeba histolytica HM-1:IMSS]
MQPKKNYFILQANDPTINVSWVNSNVHPFRSVYSTFSDCSKSYLHLVGYEEVTDSIKEITSCPTTSLPFPPTSIKFIPKSNPINDMIITSGDNLRLFCVPQSNDIFQLSVIDVSYSAYPSCGFDWCRVNTDLVCAWYLNNTCCVWSIESSQIIASFSNHITQQILDMKYSPSSPDLFITSCVNGLIQITDIRSTSNFQLFPQGNQKLDLLQVSWNTIDPTKIATFNSLGNQLFIMDIRQPTKLYNHLQLDTTNITSIDWSPTSSSEICLGTFKSILIWSQNSKLNKQCCCNNLLETQTKSEVNDVCWSKSNTNWIAASIGSSIHFLHVY